MNDYVLSVAFAIIFCVGINLLVPSPKYMGIIKIVCGVFVVYTILTPIKNLVNYKAGSFEINQYIDESVFLFDIEKSQEKFEKLMSESSVKIIEDAIADDLSKIHNTDIVAEILGDTVYISNASDEDCNQIIEYIKKQYGLKTIFR